MKSLKLLGAFLFTLVVISFFSCQIGLGSQVDTATPSAEITYPDPESIIRGSFVIKGSCSDDMGVTKVAVTLGQTNSATGGTVQVGKTQEADISDNGAESSEGAWSISIDPTSFSSTELKDGSYIATVVASDKSGHSSSTLSLAFSIDNTAPVFIISSPSSKTISNPTPYGRKLKVAGQIADDHTIKQMNVSVYNSSTKAQIGSTIQFTNVEPSSVASGKVIAQYVEKAAAYRNGTSDVNPGAEILSLYDNYLAIYNNGEKIDTSDRTSLTTKDYYIVIELVDNAAQYTGSSKDSTEGNKTVYYYNNDDINSTLLSSSGYGLNADSIKKILNGTYTGSLSLRVTAPEGTADAIADIKQILSDAQIDTTQITDTNTSSFSLNPDAAPRYDILSSSYTTGEDGSSTISNRLKSVGSEIIYTATPGRDAVNLEPWTFAANLYKIENNIVPSTPTFSIPSGYAEAKGSAESYTGTFTIPESYTDLVDGTVHTVTPGDRFAIEITGTDQEDEDLYSESTYGFQVAASGNPPTVSFGTTSGNTNVVTNSYISSPSINSSDSDRLLFSGLATTDSSAISKVKFTVAISNDDNNSSLFSASASEDITPVYKSVNGSGVKTYSWYIDVGSLLSAQLTAAQTSVLSNGTFLYTITATAYDNTDLESSVTRQIYVDTVSPVLTFDSITPLVDGAYLNGVISISGSLEETNPSSVYYTVTSGSADNAVAVYQYDTETSSYTEKFSLGKLWTKSGSFDTTASWFKADSSSASGYSTFTCADNSALTVTVTAIDKSGRTDTESKTYTLNQSSDCPSVSFTNADSSIIDATGIKTAYTSSAAKTNIFGITSNNKLLGEVTDDDGIATISITYDTASDGTFSNKLFSATGLSTTSYSITNASFSKLAEGLYFIKVAVTDTLGKTSYSTYSSSIFAVAVDTGAPSFSSVAPANGGYYSSKKPITVTGKVADASGAVSLMLTSAGNGTSKKYASSTSLTLANGSASIADTVTPPSADGSYEVVYTATDAYGQSSTYAITYLVDTTAPSYYATTYSKDDAAYLVDTEISTKSTSQQATLVVSDTCTSSGALYSSTVTSGIYSVAWSIDDGKSTGNSGVLNYLSSYTGGSETINSNFSIYKGTLLLTDGVKNTVTFTITDNAGNSTEVTTNPVYTVDSTAPSISITGYDSTYNGSKTVSFTVTATDNKKLDASSDSYKITASNNSGTATLGTDYTVTTSGTDTDTTAVRTVTILSGGSFNGNWTFTANVKDAAGWPATQQSNTLLVDSIAPEITVTNLADNAGLYGDAGSYKAYLDTSTGNYSLRGKWKDVTSSGIAGSGTNKLSYSFDGTDYRDFSDTANVTTEKNFTVDLPVTEGKKKDIYLKATDIAGNTSAVKHFTGIAIDYSAPVVSFKDNITQYTAKGGTLTFTATSTDSYAISASDVTVTATKDGAEVPLDASFTASSAQTGSSTKSVTTTINVAAGTTGTYDGSWVFTVSATDGSGRTVTKSTNSTILIDTRSATYIDNLSTTPTATKSTSLPVTLIVSDTCTSDGSSTYTGSDISSVNWSVNDTHNSGQNGTLNYSEQYTGGSGSNATTINNNFAVYKGTVLLTDGYTNTITFSITDKAGNKTTVAKQPVYTVDTIIPTITIADYKKSTSSKEDITFTATLEDNSKLDLSASSIVIKGANDSGNATLGTDYTVATSGTDNATKAVRTITILKAGSHDGNWTFTINVKDAAGWSAEQKTISVQVDTTAPTVVTAASVNNVTAISDIYYIKKANGCTFKGTVKDALSGLKNVYVKVLKSSESAPSTFTALEWTAADINPTTGAWSYVLDTSSTAYSDNTNYKLYAVAVDALNNASAIELTGTIAEVFADASVPVFTFAETPASSTSSGSATTTMTYEATYYRSSAAAISGTVTDSSFSGCTYTLTTNPNNDAGSVSKTVPTTSGGTWSVTPVALKTGNYVYTFTATDKAGYSSKAVITVVVDKTAPTFTITNSEVSTASKLQSNSTITESNAYYTTSGSNSYYTVSGTWTDDDNGTAGTGTYKLYYTKDSTATTDSLTGWTDAGATTSATGSTKWSVDIPVSENTEQYLAFFAVDNAGNKSVVTSFTGLAYDFSAPVAAFTSISGTSYKCTGEAQAITVVGTVTDSYKIASATPTAKLGGNTVSSGSKGLVISTVNTDSKTKTVTYTVTIDATSGEEDGIWVFSLTGADASGRNATLVSSSSITVDTIAPTLTVSNATNDSANLLSTGTKLITETNSNYKVSGGSSYYVLTGKWSDATTGTSTLEYSTDGGSNWKSITGVAQTTSETSWNVDVPVAQATSTGSIQVRATDAAGNVTTPTADSTKFTGLTFDFAVPTVSLTNGTSEVVTNTAPFALTGTIVDTLSLPTSGSTHGLTITATKNGSSDSSLSATFTEKTANKDYSFSIPLTEGKWVVTVKATDNAGRTSASVTSSTIIVDTTEPSFVNTTANPFTVAGKTYAETVWLSDTSLSFVGYYNESTYGSGISTIYYWINPDGTSVIANDTTKISGEITPNTSIGEACKFSATIAGFTTNSSNKIYFAAKDVAGNIENATSYYTINIDATPPTIAPVSSDIVLSNAGKEITATGTVSDSANASGVDTSIGKITSTVGTIAYTTGTTYTLTLSTTVLGSLSNGTHVINAKVYDNAGNSYTGTVCTLQIDHTAPVVTITSPASSATVNKTITVSGMASDTNSFKYATLWYSTDCTTKGNDATWTQYAYNTANASYIYKSTNYLKVSDNSWSYMVDTTSVYNETGTQTLSFKIFGEDEAGNTNTAIKTVTINQNADRPVINITNVTDVSGSYIMKYGKEATLEGTVKDDDSTDSAITKTILCSPYQITAIDSNFAYDTNGTYTNTLLVNGTTSVDYKYTYSSGVGSWTATGYGTTTYTVATGDWTYKPADTTDGSKSVYFYIVDNNSSTFYTGTTNILTEPYQQVKGGTETDNTSAFAYKADSNPPEVTLVKVATSDASAGTYTDYASFSASTALGGTKKRYAKFQVTAKDNNGISSITLTVNGISNTLTGNTSSDSTAVTWTSSTAMDLSSLVVANSEPTGSVAVVATAKDTSELSGILNASFYNDFEVDMADFKVTSPVSDSDGLSTAVLTSDVTISGVSGDGSGAGIASDGISWYIPGTGVTATNVTDSPSSYTWNSTLYGTSTAKAWSFLFDYDTGNCDQLTEYCDATKYNITKTTGNPVYKIPVYFKLVDELGNVGVYTSCTLQYNPYSNWPTAEITYPLTGQTVGSTVRVTGSATDNVSISHVYMQIATSLTGSVPDWNSSNGKLATGGYTITTIGTGSNQIQIGNTTSSISDGVDASTWWGIEATNTVSWNKSINGKGEFDPLEGANANTIYIRVCAVDNENLCGLWSDPITVKVDLGVPLIGKHEMYLAQYTDDDCTKKETARTSYSSDMYLTKQNGGWFIVVSAEDEQGVTNITVKENSSTDITSNCTIIDKNYSAASTDYPDKLIYIPVSMTTNGSVTYTVSATENNTQNKRTTSYTFSLNVDNTAPTIADLTSSNVRIAASTSVKGNKLVNSNGGTVTFGSSVTDESSGFSKLAYYFVKDSNLYNPVPSGSSSTWSKQTATAYDITGLTRAQVTGADTTSDTTDDNYLYGASIYGTLTKADLKFTPATSADVTANTNIRQGSMIRINGIYYLIKSISSGVITIDAESIPSSSDSESVTAFFPYAIIVQYDSSKSSSESTPSNSTSSFTITNDDGDGVIESISKSGVKWTWDSSFISDSINDGEISIVVVAFDNANNISSTTTTTMIANETPRLSKVYLATDLNSNGIYEDTDFVYSKETNGVPVDTYAYSALDSSGNAQEVVTLTDPATNKFVVRNGLAVTVEYVSGSSGGGDTVSYIPKLLVSTSTTATLATVATGATTGDIADLDTKVSTTNGVSKNGFVLSNSDITGLDSYTKTNNIADYENTSTDNLTTNLSTKVYMQLSLWDNTTGTKVGTADAYDTTTGLITTYGNQYTILNVPVYLDTVDDCKPTIAFNNLTKDSVYSVTGDTTVYGHVEQSDYLPGTTFTGSSGEYDANDKVSGKVVFTGTVTENNYVNKLYLRMANTGYSQKIPNLYSSSSPNRVCVATYDTTKGSLVFNTTYAESSFATNGFYITGTETFTQSAGHTVTWKLGVDTSKITSVAASDIILDVYAEDANTTALTGENTYQVDIVPYITGITRTATTNSNTDMNRSTYGEYPVALGDTLTVTGYNFSTAANTTVKVGTTAVTVDDNSLAITDGTTMTFTVPANSGELTATVNSMVNLNAQNNNGIANNQETNSDDDQLFYDNRYIRVWDLNHYFSNSTDGNKPTMATDNSGNLFSTWTLLGSSTVQIQRGLAAATSKPLYVCFDQPDKESWLSVDKSATTGGVSVMYFPANVGWSGTPDTTGYAHAAVIGGAWGVGIDNNLGNLTYGNFQNPVNANGKRKFVLITGNPYTKIDSKIETAGWQLASYSMRRDVSQFANARTVRSGANMHFAYYDTKNKALRYTYQPTKICSTDNGNEEYLKKISGWILIDGSNDGQDRVHSSGTYDIANDEDSSTNKIFDTVNSGSVVLKTVNYSLTSNGKCTVGIAYTDTTGKYRLDLHEAKVGTDYKTLTFTDGSTYDTTNTCTGGAVYFGSYNVVGYGDDGTTTSGSSVSKSSSAGSYLSMDVTKTGKPVIVYYDADGESLRIAYSTSETPNMATTTGRDTWTRQSTSLTGGTYVQCKIDGNNFLHIVYRNKTGKLCYVKSTEAVDGAAYSFGTPMVIDSSGTYCTLSLIRSGTTGSYTYTPCVSFLNSEGTANGVKYAVLRSVDQGAATAGDAVTSTSLWDTEIVPAVVSSGNHFVNGGELVYVEGYNGWTDTTTVDTSACDAIVGFNTGRMDVVFLKK